MRTFRGVLLLIAVACVLRFIWIMWLIRPDVVQPTTSPMLFDGKPHDIHAFRARYTMDYDVDIIVRNGVSAQNTLPVLGDIDWQVTPAPASLTRSQTMVTYSNPVSVRICLGRFRAQAGQTYRLTARTARAYTAPQPLNGDLRVCYGLSAGKAAIIGLLVCAGVAVLSVLVWLLTLLPSIWRWWRANGSNVKTVLRRDARKHVQIVAVCIGASVLYGIVHDQITARICVEYFTVGHPPIFHTSDPTLLGLGWGIYATWWVGAFFAIPLCACALHGSPPQATVRYVTRSVAQLLCVVGVCALCAGLFAAYTGGPSLGGEFGEKVPVAHQHAFIIDWATHSASYTFSLLGGIVLCWRVWRERTRKAE